MSAERLSLFRGYSPTCHTELLSRLYRTGGATASSKLPLSSPLLLVSCRIAPRSSLISSSWASPGRELAHSQFLAIGRAISVHTPSARIGGFKNGTSSQLNTYVPHNLSPTHTQSSQMLMVAITWVLVSYLAPCERLLMITRYLTSGGLSAFTLIDSDTNMYGSSGLRFSIVLHPRMLKPFSGLSRLLEVS